MGDVVNLRQARKRQARSVKEATARQSRASHGMKNSEKLRNKAEITRADITLDQHRIEPDLDNPKS